MKASRAREISNSKSTNSVFGIYILIRTAAVKGETEIIVQNALTADIIKRLSDSGYSVVDLSGRNHSCYKISW